MSVSQWEADRQEWEQGPNPPTGWSRTAILAAVAVVAALLAAVITIIVMIGDKPSPPPRFGGGPGPGDSYASGTSPSPSMSYGTSDLFGGTPSADPCANDASTTTDQTRTPDPPRRDPCQ